MRAHSAWVAVGALVVLGVAACDGGGPPGPGPTVTASPRASATVAVDVDCRPPAVGAPARDSVLVPGPSNGLKPSAAKGEPLVIQAVVVQRDCRPAVGARVHLWHADATGRYGPAGTEGCCYYEGAVATDTNGRFELRTVRPAQYPVPDAPPAHIHLEIRHIAANLNSEIVFAAGASTGPPAGPVRPTGDEIAVALRRSGGGWRAAAVFVLAGTT